MSGPLQKTCATSGSVAKISSIYLKKAFESRHFVSIHSQSNIKVKKTTHFLYRFSCCLICSLDRNSDFRGLCAVSNIENLSKIFHCLFIGSFILLWIILFKGQHEVGLDMQWKIIILKSPKKEQGNVTNE